MRPYRLYDFMQYPNIAFKLAMIQPFTWSGALPDHQRRHQQHHHHHHQKQQQEQQHRNDRKCLLMKVWFIFGATNLIYQNFGMLIYLMAPQLTHYPVPSNMAEDVTAAANNDHVELVAQISETGGIMGLTLVGVCKMFIMFWHGGRISKLLEELQKIFPHREMDSRSSVYRVHHFAQSSRTLMRRTTIFFMFAFCFYNSLPIVEIVYEYLSPEREIVFRYQSNTWYPWQTKENARTWLNFIASYLCQVQSSLTGVAFIMAGEFMLCFFITQMQMHFDYLTNALRMLDASSPTANVQLKLLIVYHIKLLRYSKEINAIFNISFLVNFATSSIAICLMGFSMLMISLGHAFKYSVGVLSFLVFDLFICYNGSEFTAASDQLLSAAFYNNWYEGDMSYRRMIYFFMMRATESNVLKAYKFTTVSMPTFMAILKFSYQLFAFVRTMG